jgi:hypothetical protein
MPRADSPTQAFSNAWSREESPSAAIASMKPRQGQGTRILGERSDKARVCADGNEAAARSQDTADLRKDSPPVIDIGVDEASYNRVERRIREWDSSRVGLNQQRRASTLPSNLQLVVRKVEPYTRPTELANSRQLHAAAAADVQAAAVVRSQPLANEWDSAFGEARQVRVVPRRVSVVQSATHCGNARQELRGTARFRPALLREDPHKPETPRLWRRRERRTLGAQACRAVKSS